MTQSEVYSMIYNPFSGSSTFCEFNVCSAIRRKRRQLYWSRNRELGQNVKGFSEIFRVSRQYGIIVLCRTFFTLKPRQRRVVLASEHVCL